MKKRNILLIVLALSLVLISGIGSAMAYFTTYAEVKGGYTIHLGSETEIHEEVSNWTKHVTIENKEGSEPVFVRAKAFCGSAYQLSYTSDGSWTDGGDGYYYYNAPISEKESTSELLIKIDNIPEDDETAEFNVVVVYESTPARYHENGEAYADWTAVLDHGTTEGGRGA